MSAKLKVGQEAKIVGSGATGIVRSIHRTPKDKYGEEFWQYTIEEKDGLLYGGYRESRLELAEAAE